MSVCLLYMSTYLRKKWPWESTDKALLAKWNLSSPLQGLLRQTSQFSISEYMAILRAKQHRLPLWLPRQIKSFPRPASADPPFVPCYNREPDAQNLPTRAAVDSACIWQVTGDGESPFRTSSRPTSRKPQPRAQIHSRSSRSYPSPSIVHVVHSICPVRRRHDAR